MVEFPMDIEKTCFSFFLGPDAGQEDFEKLEKDKLLVEVTAAWRSFVMICIFGLVLGRKFWIERYVLSSACL